MLKECGLPYVVKYVNIEQGDQFKPCFLKIAANNRRRPLLIPVTSVESRFQSSSQMPFCGTSVKRPEDPIQKICATA